MNNPHYILSIERKSNRIVSLSQEDIERMGENARNLVKRSLTPQKMGERALSIL